MMRFFRLRRAVGPRLKWSLALIAVVVLVEGTIVGSYYGSERARLKRESSRSFSREGPYSDRYAFIIDGVRTPPTRPAREARLADSERVIGVVAGGKPRAYRFASMKRTDQHIINDVVGDVPVSVTYCDLSDCLRAFTSPGKADPLDIKQGGLKGNQMVIRVGGIDFVQETGAPLDPRASGTAIPYEPLVTTRTSWKSWKDAHPNTDVYEGPEDFIPD